MVNLRSFRTENGLTQDALGEFLGVGKSYISRVENGKEKLSQEKLTKLLTNDRGWETSMLLSPSSELPTIEVIASNGSEAKLQMGSGNVMGDSDGYVLVLKNRIKELERQLTLEKTLSERYLKMLETAMGK